MCDVACGYIGVRLAPSSGNISSLVTAETVWSQRVETEGPVYDLSLLQRAHTGGPQLIQGRGMGKVCWDGQCRAEKMKA